MSDKTHLPVPKLNTVLDPPPMVSKARYVCFFSVENVEARVIAGGTATFFTLLPTTPVEINKRSGVNLSNLEGYSEVPAAWPRFPANSTYPEGYYMLARPGEARDFESHANQEAVSDVYFDELPYIDVAGVTATADRVTAITQHYMVVTILGDGVQVTNGVLWVPGSTNNVSIVPLTTYIKNGLKNPAATLPQVTNGLGAPEFEPVVVPIPLPFQDILDFPSPDFLQLGYVQLELPPQAMQIHQMTNMEAYPVMRNRGSLNRISGPNGVEIQFVFSLIGTEMINSVLIPVLNQFNRTPFVPVFNARINEEWGIQALTMKTLSVTTLETQPNVLSVSMVCEPFHWEYYMRESELDFADMWCWPLFKIWCETRSNSVPLGEGMNEDLAFATPNEQVLASILEKDKTTEVLTPFQRDAEFIKRLVDPQYTAFLVHSNPFIDATTQTIKDISPGIVFNYNGRGLHVLLKFEDVENLLMAMKSATDVYGSSVAIKFLGDDTSSAVRVAAPERPGLSPAERKIEYNSIYATREDPSVARQADFSNISVILPLNWPGFTEILNRHATQEKAKAAQKPKTIETLNDADYDFFTLSESTVILAINAQASNLLTSLPVSMQPFPVHQFIGGTDFYFTIQGTTHNPGDIDTLRSMVERVVYLARHFRGGPRGIEYGGFVRVDNELFQLMGVTHCLPLRCTVGTVEGVPGEYSFQLDLVEFDPAQRDYETLTHLEEEFITQLEKQLGDGKNGTVGWHEKVSDDSAHKVLRHQYLTERLKLLELYPDMKLPTYTELNDWITKLKAMSAVTVDITQNYSELDDTVTYKGQKHSVFALAEEFFTLDNQELFDKLEPGIHNRGFADPDFYVVPYSEKIEFFAKQPIPYKNRFPGIRALSKLKMQDLIDTLVGTEDPKIPHAVDKKANPNVTARVEDPMGAYLQIKPNAYVDENNYNQLPFGKDDPTNAALIAQELKELEALVTLAAEAPDTLTKIQAIGPNNFNGAVPFNLSTQDIKDTWKAHTGALLSVRQKFEQPFDTAITQVLVKKNKVHVGPLVEKMIQSGDLNRLLQAVITIESDAGTSMQDDGVAGTGVANPMQLTPPRDYPGSLNNLPQNLYWGTDHLINDIDWAQRTYPNASDDLIMALGVTAYNHGQGAAGDIARRQLAKYGNLDPQTWSRADSIYATRVLACYYYLQQHQDPTALNKAQTAAQVNQLGMFDQKINDAAGTVAAGEAEGITPEIDGAIAKAVQDYSAKGVDAKFLRTAIRTCLYFGSGVRTSIKLATGESRWGLLAIPDSYKNATGDRWVNSTQNVLIAAKAFSILPGGTSTTGATDRFLQYMFGIDPDSPFAVQVEKARYKTRFKLYYNGDHVPEAHSPGNAFTPTSPGRPVTNEDTFRGVFQDMITYNQDGRLVKAFPTYLVMLVDGGKWLGAERLHDHFYGGFGITGIDVVQSRENPVDVATITFSNMYGNLTALAAEISQQRMLDTRLQWTWDAIKNGFEDFVNFAVGNGTINDDNERRWRLRLNSLMIKPGARLHIRLGCGSDASQMPVRFNGVISDVPAADSVVQVVALGDGVELTNPLPFDQLENDPVNIAGEGGNKYYVDTAFFKQGVEPREIIQKFFAPSNTVIAGLSQGHIFSDNANGINHFGTLDYATFPVIRASEIGVNIYDSSPNAEKNTAAWKRWVDIGHYIGDQDVFIGVRVENATPWDVISTCRLAVHDYVAAVRPFEMRSILFFGRQNYPFFYQYTRSKGDVRALSDWSDVEAMMDSKPFSQFHIVASHMGLIRSEVSASSEGIYNNVIATSAFAATVGSDFRVESNNQQVDSDIYPEHQKRLVCETGLMSSTRQEQLQSINPFKIGTGLLGGSPVCSPILNNAAVQKLRDSVSTMYQGMILSMGDPSINAWDYCYINDAELRLQGMVQVREVTHSFSIEGGFVTGIVPDCITALPGIRSTQTAHLLLELGSRVVAIRLSHMVGSNMVRNAVLPKRAAAWMLENKNIVVDYVKKNYATLAKDERFIGYKDILIRAVNNPDSLLNPTAMLRKGIKNRFGLDQLSEAQIARQATRAADAAEKTALSRGGIRAARSKRIGAAVFKSVQRHLSFTNAEYWRNINPALLERLFLQQKLNYLETQAQHIVNEALQDFKPNVQAARARKVSGQTKGDRVKAKARAKAVQNNLAEKQLAEATTKAEAAVAEDIAATKALLTVNGNRPFFKVAAALRQSFKEGGTLTKLGGFLARGIEGGWVGIAAEVIAYCTFGSIGDMISRYLAARQALVIFPLRINGREFSAGLNGHLGAVAGDPLSKYDEMLLAITNSDYATKHFGKLGGIIPFILDFIFPGVDGAALYDNKDILTDYRQSLAMEDSGSRAIAPWIAHLQNKGKAGTALITAQQETATNRSGLASSIPPGRPVLAKIGTRGGVGWSIRYAGPGTAESYDQTNFHLIEDLSSVAQANGLHLVIESAGRTLNSATSKARTRQGLGADNHNRNEAVDINQINGISGGSPGFEQAALALKDALVGIGYTWLTPYGGNGLSFGAASYTKSERDYAKAIIFGTSDHMTHIHISRNN